MATFILKTTEHFFVVVCDLALDYVNSCTWTFKLQVAAQLAHEDLHDLFRRVISTFYTPSSGKNVKTTGFWQLQPPLFIYNTSGNSGFSFLANKLRDIAF